MLRYMGRSRRRSCLGFLAARTRRLELGVPALVVPQRNPLVALKQLATLDFLSGGRIVTAVAVGWMEGGWQGLARNVATGDAYRCVASGRTYA
jgi:alkanesulfonate monooxygenase SsuD/methylene tetrahydromethanopterin reductase-like flavin-dependent oxidoreductase (luciferase family)